MIRLSPCIEMLFADTPDFYDRFAAAAKAGAETVEFWNWTGKDLPRIKALAEENNLKIGAFCVAGDNAEFNQKRLMYREAIPAFKEVCAESIEKAKYLGCPSLIITCGNTRIDIPRHEQHTNIVLALKAVAPMFEEAEVTLVLEPLNVLTNHMGYFLDSSYEAFAIIEEVGSPAVKLLFDVYHQQISNGNLIDTIKKFGHLWVTTTLPTYPAATNPAPVKSTTPTYSVPSMPPATRPTWVWSTVPWPPLPIPLPPSRP